MIIALKLAGVDGPTPPGPKKMLPHTAEEVEEQKTYGITSKSTYHVSISLLL